jgi:hypothetical protein
MAATTTIHTRFRILVLLIRPPFFNSDYVISNTVIGRVKEQKLHRDPRISISNIDMDNPTTGFNFGPVSPDVSKATMAV